MNNNKFVYIKLGITYKMNIIKGITCVAQSENKILSFCNCYRIAYQLKFNSEMILLSLTLISFTNSNNTMFKKNM